MSEVDLSNVNVLLDHLKDDSIEALISKNGYEKEALEYLNLVCNDGSYDLTKPDSITMELAELENKESVLRGNVQKKAIANIDLIISAHEAVDKHTKAFGEDFNIEFEELYNKINEEDWKSSSTSMANPQLQHAQHAQQHQAQAHQHQQQQQAQQQAALSSSVILQKIDSIMDILELPALTAACVKQGHYSESLEISSHAERLSIRYSDIKIIAKIEKDIKAEIKEMLVGLIRLLRTDLKQSSILKIMTYLKRTNPFNSTDDKELKLVYLQARYRYVTNELEVLTPIKNSNVEKYLKRNIEVIRENCFSTIVTFENIFNSKDQPLLREFVVSIILQLVDILRENLPLVKDQTAKENLLLQLCYCSGSLNRIGFEFSAVLLSELSKDNIISVNEWLVVTQRKKKLSF